MPPDFCVGSSHGKDEQEMRGREKSKPGVFSSLWGPSAKAMWPSSHNPFHLWVVRLSLSGKSTSIYLPQGTSISLTVFLCPDHAFLNKLFSSYFSFSWPSVSCWDLD